MQKVITLNRATNKSLNLQLTTEKQLTLDEPALTRGSKFACAGAGCLLNNAQSGNSSKIRSATEQLANNMNSSTIEFVSLTENGTF